MISNEDRENLVKYRIEQAYETIELAKFLFDSNKLNVCVNRIYYGLYYAVSALAIQNGFETSKHSQLIGWFNKTFIASGLIETRYGKILRNAYQNRRKGDYDAYVIFGKDEVFDMHIDMIAFVQTIDGIIGTKTTKP